MLSHFIGEHDALPDILLRLLKDGKNNSMIIIFLLKYS